MPAEDKPISDSLVTLMGNLVDFTIDKISDKKFIF